jgi:hypothetical protein
MKNSIMYMGLLLYAQQHLAGYNGADMQLIWGDKMIQNSGGESFWKATTCKTKEMVGKYLDRTWEDGL